MYSKSEKRRTSGGHNLAFKMWTTRGARFCADERCQRIAKLSSITTALLSIEIIAINLASLAKILPESFNDNIVNVLTLIFSIFVLVLGIFETAKNYMVKAQKYHTCGLEISRILLDLNAKMANHLDDNYNEIDEIERLNNLYQFCLEKHENHEHIDFIQFMLNRKVDFNLSFWNRTIKWLSIYYRSSLMYHVLIALGPLLLLMYLI